VLVRVLTHLLVRVRNRAYRLVALAALAPVTHTLSAQTQSTVPQSPRLVVEPRQPSDGALVKVTIDRLARNGDSVVSVTGHMAGERLHFIFGTGDRRHALAAIPVDVSDSLIARARVTRASGAVDPVRVVLQCPHRKPPPPSARGGGGFR
jgi:hypothetical protein